MPRSDEVRWEVRVDRRRGEPERVSQALEALALGVEGMGFEAVTLEAFEGAPDGGKFRDFIPLGTISHLREEALAYVAEELLHEFGWGVDFRPVPSPSSS